MPAPRPAPYPTLADLTRAKELELTCVVGHDWLSRSVTWVHVAEVTDPSPWLTRGVLLLTTGLIERTPESLDELFRRLREHGVAGVGFGVGLTVEEIPQEWRSAAVKHQLPLLRVPLTTPYIAIAEHVSARIAEAQMSQVQRLLDLQQRLAAAPGPGLRTEALETLAAELEATVVWRDAAGDPASAGRVLGDGEMRAISGELSRHAASGRRSTSVSLGARFVHIASTAGAPIAVTRMRRYSPLEQGMIGSIAFFIDDSRTSSRGDVTATSFRERVLTEALTGRLEGDARLFELLLGSSTRCTVVHLGPSPDPGLPSMKEPAAGLLLKAHLANAWNQAEFTVVPLLCAVGSEFIIVIPGADHQEVQPLVTQFLANETGNLASWRAGISRTAPASGLLDLRAEAARAHLGTRERDVVAVSYAELSRREAWSASIDASRTVPVFAEWRRRLEMLDPALAERTRVALHAYLAANGAIERAAAQLAVHRQTLRSHLHAAERDLDVRLDAPTERALLWLALDSGALAPATGSPRPRGSAGVAAPLED